MTAGSAVLRGTIDPGRIPVSWAFDLGTSDAYGRRVPATPAAGGPDPAPVQAAADGLAPSTVYHYRVVMTGTGIDPVVGADRTFTTPAAPPAPPAPAQTTTTPAPSASLPPVRFSSALTLPSARRCVSRRRFRIRVRRVAGVTFTRMQVSVNGKPARTVRGARLGAPVDLGGLPKGRVTVRIRLTTADGRTVTGRRTYRTCAAKARRR